MVAATYKRDIEEPDDVLDQGEPSPVAFWEKKQRDLVTSVVDYNLATLADLIGNETIDLSPEYQRRFRWDEVKQSRLVESFLMNVPVPPIFLNEDEFGKYSVIDGKQRLHAIHRFMRGHLKLRGLEVFAELNDHTFEDLPRDFQNVMRTRPTLRAVIILRQSGSEIKFEVFQRLNTGGVHLNPQEIRNSTYTGSLNDLILDLSTHPDFHRLLGIKNKERSAIYQEMRDAEFVLRFFTFRDCWAEFSGGMKKHMDKFMENNRRIDLQECQLLRDDFLRTLEVVAGCFGAHAFKRWVPGKSQWRQQVLAALFDAEMFACRGLGTADCEARQAEIIEHMKTLFEDQDFHKSITLATNTPSYFRARIERVRQLLDSCLAP